MGTIRLLQLVAFAAFCLFVLKTAGLLLSGGYVLSGAAPAKAQAAAEAKEASATSDQKARAADDKDAADADAKKQAAGDASGGDKKGNAEGAKAPEQDGKKKPNERQADRAKADGVEAFASGATKSELAVLQSLGKRRIALEKRQRELELRENLLKAAEKRVESRIAELKSIEKRIEVELKKQDDERMARYMRLVKMYASMKPKQAAQIFNRLDLDILTSMVQRMRPQTMAKILAAMDPAAARRLTMELAKSGDADGDSDSKLPKIGGGGA